MKNLFNRIRSALVYADWALIIPVALLVIVCAVCAVVLLTNDFSGSSTANTAVQNMRTTLYNSGITKAL